ncbi:unnamed protein product [Didymodactylos carnosus]|uniref:Uncharacterized protein n=1 Tax=Didymodactylos carnosus TaxID=1234261 RepID=A0A814YQM6_9BILA|nr:unnamed protein product [Didymodactylos carnosus]CAF1233014.1 unnamed protein product [Didymodactylos carnosus]CAF3838823.1 unnamed protein product [Didymodactylos carnosus]CAF3995625.1 unnamed protein product [Didymodactylos carnosus]
MMSPCLHRIDNTKQLYPGLFGVSMTMEKSTNFDDSQDWKNDLKYNICIIDGFTFDINKLKFISHNDEEQMLKFASDELHRHEFHEACCTNNIDKVRSFLKRMKVDDINRVAFDGETVLHIASVHRYDELVNLLLNYGAFRSVRNQNNCTPCTIANYNTTKKLFERAPEKNQVQHQRFYNYDID